MLDLLLAAAAPFTLVDRKDPVTTERQLAYAVMDERGNMLSLLCLPDQHYLWISVLPDGYRSPVTPLGRMISGVESRFGSQAKPESKWWGIDDEGIKYAQSMFGEVGAKARFIDNLARNSTFAMRYRISYDQPRTIVFEYSVEITDLRNFVSACGAKGVIRELGKMGSPAAPK